MNPHITPQNVNARSEPGLVLERAALRCGTASSR